MSLSKKILKIGQVLVWATCLIVGAICFNGCKQPAAKSNNNQTPPIKETQVKRTVIVEIIAAENSVLPLRPLYDLAKSFALDTNDVSRWKNRAIVYANISDPEELVKKIQAKYSQYSIKFFDKPFYTFNRSMCADTIGSKKWDNICLSANLVDDAQLQQEYMNYHATQFKKWPEVSKGFCNASFQQLLVFKNGRQLMLVISIPKGESLDKLNPKTTENNPRVDEWNKLMTKYQEGLPGTKPGEVWVFFKK